MSAIKIPIPVLLVLASIHCGAGRSDLGVYASEDAATAADSSLGADTSRIVDSSIVMDAAAPCTPPVFSSRAAGDLVSCKFDVSWTCGTTKYEATGACAPPGTKQGFGSGIQGGCRKDGVQVGSINNPDPKSCSCTDASFMVSTVAKTCGFPTNG